MSQRILVDTEDLRKKARRLKELSGIFRDMGDRMNRVCLGVPSYGGQLSGPANGAATQILYETGVMRDVFQWHGDFLENAAAQFEQTDQERVEAFIKYYADGIVWWTNYYKYFFTGEAPIEGDMINGYADILKYAENGTVVTIWCRGSPLSIDLGDPALSPDEREALRLKLDAFRNLMGSCLEHLKKYLGGDEALFGIAISLIGTGLNILDITNILSKMGLTFGKYLGDETELRLSEEAFTQAAALWEELNAQDVPGKVASP